MSLKRRDEVFVHRILVLSILAIAMGVGVVMVKESSEMSKLIEPSLFRDLSLLAAPLAGLALTGFSMKSKTFSSGSLLGEVIALGGSYFIFLAVALPSFLKREVVSANECRFWEIFCSETLTIRDHRISAVFLALGVGLLIVSLFRAGVIGHKTSD